MPVTGVPMPRKRRVQFAEPSAPAPLSRRATVA
jgi:hypothetical protein